MKHFVKSAQPRDFPLATLLAILLQVIVRPASIPRPRRSAPSVFSLHGWSGARKYLNVAERRRFHDALEHLPADARLFCLVLMWSGCRVSEALALTPAAIDLDTGVVSFVTLKRRKDGIIRQIPIPKSLADELEGTFALRARQLDPLLNSRRLWRWNRVTAWRRIKKVMHAAGIMGLAASPKGLRHTFGVAAFQAHVPPHIVQRWLGHASLRTTAIYGDVSRDESARLGSGGMPFQGSRRVIGPSAHCTALVL